MQRRAFLFACSAAALRADPRSEIYDFFGALANSLAEGNAVRFLHAFDPETSGYQELVANVTALVQQADIHSTIEIVEDAGDARERKVRLDWLLQFTGKQSSANAIRRQEMVNCRVVKTKRNWRIVSIHPIGFFAPPKIGE
jgi:hypothetical protein